MNYLENFEPKVIDIRYMTQGGHGAMNVDVGSFLEEQTIVKIKKLLKLIRISNTPETEQVIVDYCKQWLGQYEVVQKINANSHVQSMERVRKVEIDVEYHKRMRDRYRKNTEPYKEIAKLLKDKRKELSAEKQIAWKYLTEFNRNKKIKEKFDKVIEFINQG